MQLYVVGTGLAMVAYGAFSIRHAGKFGWLYVVSGRLDSCIAFSVPRNLSVKLIVKG